MKTVDRFGRLWNKPEKELCPKCGQPDNCGGCSCKKLSGKEAKMLGAEKIA